MVFKLTQTKAQRDYFQIQAPASAVERAFGPAVVRSTAVRSLVLNIQAGADAPLEMRLEGRPVPVISFQAAAKGLAALAMDTEDFQAKDGWSLYVPRAAFDRVADQYGARRITALTLAHGAGRDDVVLAHLGACLEHALELKPAPNPAIVEQISLALNLHLAQRYGGLQPPRTSERGGLAPWQLRLARHTLDRHLDGSVALETLALECGLSVSHFSRAFSRSTGMAPHRWLMNRRIEVAKDMILQAELPLAQIALACGFSDQSHFTRAFSALAGMTPGRWRMSQDRPDLREFATVQMHA